MTEQPDRNPRQTPRSGAGGLRQAEHYGGPASDGVRADRAASGAEARGPSVVSAYVGGVAMIGTTILSGWLLQAPPLLAFLLGLAVFVLVVAAMRPGGLGRSLSAGPLRADRAAAAAAGVDPARADARLADAEARLTQIEMTAAELGDRPLEDRIRAMTAAVRQTLAALAADPGDIDRAKKFLVVTIPSAAAAVEKYAKLGVRDAELSGRFATLMDEVAEAAHRQKAALARDDAFALEVEMEVLADRLRSG